MIHEEVCTYEVCKLAKEKGFNGSGCFKHYDQNGLLRSNRSFSRFDLTIAELYNHDTPSEVQVYAPTQSLLQRWLREEKGYYVYPFFDNGSKRWTWVCRELTGDMWIQLLDFEERYFDAYELALEDALKYALENLI